MTLTGKEWARTIYEMRLAEKIVADAVFNEGIRSVLLKKEITALHNSLINIQRTISNFEKAVYRDVKVPNQRYVLSDMCWKRFDDIGEHLDEFERGKTRIRCIDVEVPL